MKLNCIVDNRGYSSKPKGYEIGGISDRLSNGKKLSLSIDEFKRELEEGKSYLSGHFKDKSKGRVKYNMKDINFFSLDIDNHYKKDKKDIYTDYSIDEAIEKVKDILGIEPIISYTTFSKVNKENNSKRFRLIYGLNFNADSNDLELIFNHISSNDKDMFDKSTVDDSRLFFSTSEEVKIYKDYKLLEKNTVKELEKLKEEAEKESMKQVYKSIEKKRNNNKNILNNVIEEIKGLDISDYLVNLGYTDIKKTRNGYKMPCPIHGGKNDNFHISNIGGIYLYKCFSKCGGAGGSIIDLHMALNNINEGQAIRELKDMYNVEPIINPRTREAYIIGSYIGEDVEATRGVMRALKQNKKILITGSMGIGKTHFIFNNVYEYAKSLGKTLITIIPNVSQLVNLNINKDIPIVCQDMPVYMGNDRVATTPESLKKVIDQVGANNYILVIDESHERYTSSGYRRGYRGQGIQEAEKNSYKSIHLTATPRLLVFDKFDKEINIKSKNIITNNIEIIKVRDKIQDNILSISNNLLKAGKKPIVFNNNINDNELLKKELGQKESIIIKEYKEGQIDLFNDDPLETVKETTLIKAETVKSGDIPESIKKGQINSDVTLTTSTIQAGIDLYADENAVLIINTSGILFDSIIQLIGRFRHGIDVKIIVNDREKSKVFDLEYITQIAINDSQGLADKLNSGSLEGERQLELINSGIKQDANIVKINNNWEVDKNQIVRVVCESWSKSILNNTNEFIRELKKQDAFKVNNVNVIEYNDPFETRISEAKKVSRDKRKKQIEESTKIMLNLTDEDLEIALYRHYETLDQDVEEAVEKYFQVAGRHLDYIRRTRKELFTDDRGLPDNVGAFRHFYNNSWASIEREIEQKETRKINQLIEEQGKDHLLSKEAMKYKTSVDVVQAKIRKELEHLEKKQGRLSNKVVGDLTNKLVQEGFIYNKYTKILNSDPTEKDRKKALKMLGDIVRAKLGYIYNFKGDIDSPLISSIKV